MKPVSQETIELLKSESAISEEMIKHNIFENDPSVTKLNGSSYVFKYIDHDGQTLGYRGRLYTPRINSRGKKQRYTSLKENQCFCYFLEKHRESIFHSKETLYITEGEKKLLALASTPQLSDLPMVAYPGVNNWIKKDSGGELNDRWNQIPVNQRVVVILPDSDFFTNFTVFTAVTKFVMELIKKGAEVHLIDLRGSQYDK